MSTFNQGQNSEETGTFDSYQNHILLQRAPHEQPQTVFVILDTAETLNLISVSQPPSDTASPSSGPVMTSRVLMRQELMRQQARDQERREAQQQVSSAQLRSADSSPAISMAPAHAGAPAQVPVEVLKTQVKTLPLLHPGNKLTNQTLGASPSPQSGSAPSLQPAASSTPSSPLAVLSLSANKEEMEDVIDDIISLESSLNDEFFTLIDSGLHLANTAQVYLETDM
ncbi:unnamed protein product [Coregonus sp. 'balchen']|nr:unnamed protein product [Coregonus sp. 'balchen']